MATMSARYTVIDGEVVAQERGGVRHQLVPDPLGSVVALYDGSGTKTDTFSYWPYGESSGRTGTTVAKFQYVGSYGYYQDSSTKNYVRARYLDSRKGMWITVDPYWPYEHAYIYANNRVLTDIDPNGTNPQRRPGPPNSNCYQWACGGPYPNPNNSRDPRLLNDCKFLVGQAKKQGLIEARKIQGKKQTVCPNGYHKVRAYINPPRFGFHCLAYLGRVCILEDAVFYLFDGDFHWVRQDSDDTWSDQHGPGGAVDWGITDPDKHNCQQMEKDPLNPMNNNHVLNYTRCPGEYCAKDSSVPLWGIKYR